MSRRLYVGIACLICASLARAAQLPEAATKDARIRFATYDPYDVVTILTRDGLETHVVLDPDERIVDMTGGDVEAWGVATKYARNGFFIKPAGPLPDANLHVVTNKRTYSFDLKQARKGKSDVAFMTVYFRFPAAEKAASAAATETEQIRRLLDEAAPANNRRYSVQGSSELAPVEAWDDGRTTFLRFRANAVIPAVYLDKADGDSHEQIVSPTVKDDVLQVPGLHRKLVLRIGREIACVFNDGFDRDAPQRETKTASPHVGRSLKGGVR